MLTLEQVMEKHPTLQRGGFGVGGPIDPEAFAAAVEFLRSAKARKSISAAPSSYGWKHIVENRVGWYIGNGDFIAAAIAIGFAHREFGINAWFNISRLSAR